MAVVLKRAMVIVCMSLAVWAALVTKNIYVGGAVLGLGLVGAIYLNRRYNF